MNLPRRPTERVAAAPGSGARWALLAALVAAALSAPARADDGTDAAEQRRLAIESAYQQASRDCKARFVSSACLDAAAVQRRDALAEWRRQRALRDDERRRLRAADRLQAVERKAREAEARRLMASPDSAGRRLDASAPRSAPSASRAAIAPAATPPTTAGLPAAAASAASGRRRPERADGPQSRVEVARRVEAFRRREQAAQAHRQAVEQRNAARDARQPPAAGLPVPDAGAAADPPPPDRAGAGERLR